MACTTNDAGIESADVATEDTVNENDNSIEEKSEEANSEEATQLANPWIELSEQEFVDKTGWSVNLPFNAEDVVYRYLENDNLSEVQFIIEGDEFCYRIQPSEEYKDISGMSYEWESEEDSCLTSESKLYCATDNNHNVCCLLWYDAAPGIMYSLNQISKEDLLHNNILEVAQNLYTPVQTETDGDNDGEASEDANEYFVGNFTNADQGFNLEISDNEDGTYKINIDIVRLCSMEDGVGTFEDNKIVFSIVDPSGNPMDGIIYRDSDNSLTVNITNSTWDDIQNNAVYSGLNKK